MATVQRRYWPLIARTSLIQWGSIAGRRWVQAEWRMMRMTEWRVVVAAAVQGVQGVAGRCRAGGHVV